ncbi:MAG: endo-1,4-beta-xylanase, partial [Bacteroidota bacterium]
MARVGNRVRAAMLIVVTLTTLSGRCPAQLAKGQTKFLGSSIGILRPTFSTYFNQVTPENDGKWGSVEGVQGSFSFSALDNIYQFAVNNAYRYKHHNLVWGNQQPSWITSLDSANQRAEVEKWIDTIAARYPSTSFVDVVNEPLHAPPGYAAALGGAGATGWDWVVTAF